MLLVHHQVVGSQIVERGDRGAALEERPAQPPPLGAEDLLLAQHHQAERRDLEAGRALPHQHPEPLRAPERRLRPRLEVVLGQHPLQAVALPLVVHHEPHREALPAPVADLADEGLELPAVGADRARAHRDARHPVLAPLEQRQLQALEPREQGRERGGRGRVVRRRLQQGGILQHHQRLRGEIVEQGHRGRLAGPERQHRELGDRPHRALRRGIEEAEGLHLVSEELGAHRLGVRGREDVDDPAAEAPLAHLEHRLHPLIAGRLQQGEQDLAVAALPDGQGEGAALEGFGRRHRDREARRGGHDDHRVAVEQPPAAEGALRVRLAVAAPAPGGAGPRRELEHAPLAHRHLRRPARQRSHEEAGVLRGLVPLHRPRGQEQDRAAGPLPHARDGERARGAPEAVGAQAGHSPGQGRQDLFEGGPSGQDGRGRHGHHTLRRHTGVPSGARGVKRRGPRQRDP